MNIAFVNSTRKWGGVKSWTLDAARALSARGHEVSIIGRPGPFVDKAAGLGLRARAVSFGPDFNPLLVTRMLRWFRSGKTDLVVVNVGKDMRSAGVAARLLDIPVVHRVGLAGDMEDTLKVRALHKWVRPALLAPCAQIKHGLLKELPYLGPEEISVVLTGKEPAPAVPENVHRPVCFISTSQLNADKGHKDALAAMSLLKKQGHDFEYHVVGTGAIEAELKALADRLGLNGRVFWHGFQPDVRALLRQADVFLLPSMNEGLPNSLLEARAEGLVCVARNVGGVAEVWPEDAPGLLLPYGARPEELARILMELLDAGDEHILALRRIFYATARENSRERMVCELERFFEEVAGRAV